MRFIASIPDPAQANRFGDYLTGIGIANTVEEADNGFSVWIHDDDLLERGKTELAAFEAMPDDPKYASAPKLAQRVRDEQIDRQKRLQRNFIDYRTSFARQGGSPTPLTLVLIVLCVIVAMFTQLGDKLEPVGDALLFGTLTPDQLIQQQQAELHRRMNERLGIHSKQAFHFQLIKPGLEQILHGQVWRLFTPMLVHFGMLHLLFNMMWLWQLGTLIERQRGTLIFAGLVLLSDLIGNVAQFYWAGPYAGGMSGVVYGLFGYVWMKSRYEPQLGLHMPTNTMYAMLIWLVVCMTGLMGNIANAAHVGGLITGVVIGQGTGSWRRFKRSLAARSSRPG